MKEEFEEILNGNCVVRRAVAGNPQTPPDILSRLAEDSNSSMKFSLKK